MERTAALTASRHQCVGIDEKEEVAGRYTGSGVARGGDLPEVDVDDASAIFAGDGVGVIHGTIVFRTITSYASPASRQTGGLPIGCGRSARPRCAPG